MTGRFILRIAQAMREKYHSKIHRAQDSEYLQQRDKTDLQFKLKCLRDDLEKIADFALQLHNNIAYVEGKGPDFCSQEWFHHNRIKAWKLYRELCRMKE